MSHIPFEIEQQVIQCFGKCFHYKETVASFMRSCGVPESLIIEGKKQPKYIWAKDVLRILNLDEDGKIIIRKIITELYKMKDIPSEVEARHEGVAALRKLKELVHQSDIIVRQQSPNRGYHQIKKEEVMREKQNKAKYMEEIKTAYYGQFSNLNYQDRGYELEKIISQLFEISGISYQKPYRNKENTQQMDGFFTFEGFNYVVEVKWKQKPIDSADIASLKQKVDTKLHATRGFFLAINGFREEVIRDYSNKDAKILFMNGEELTYVLENRITLEEALLIKITEAAKTGNPNSSIRDILF